MDGTLHDTFADAVGDFHAAAKPIIEDMLSQGGAISISDLTPAQAGAFLERMIDFCFDIGDEDLRELFTLYRERHGCVMSEDDVRTEVADPAESGQFQPDAAPSLPVADDPLVEGGSTARTAPPSAPTSTVPDHVDQQELGSLVDDVVMQSAPPAPTYCDEPEFLPPPRNKREDQTRGTSSSSGTGVGLVPIALADLLPVEHVAARVADLEANFGKGAAQKLFGHLPVLSLPEGNPLRDSTDSLSTNVGGMKFASNAASKASEGSA